MEAIQRLLAWAKVHGVVIKGIGPEPLPGRGIGIVAKRNLKAKEDILTVPAALLRSIGNTPRAIIRNLKGATVHAILAASLCVDTSPDLALWRAVLPTEDDITTCMPLSWPAALQELLPPAARALLDKQAAKFARDWARVSAAYPSLTREAYLHAWHLVNSRSFYHTTRATEKRLPTEDHMVLQPVADLFNHSPDGCSVSFDEDRYTITTTTSYEKGRELFIRYGSHSNDFLLVEYGFTLPSGMNKWDEICLDPYMTSLFSPRRKKTLQDAGFWGEWMLDSETACYRTQTALRLLCLPLATWRAVLDGQRDENEDAEAVDKELLKVLRRCEKDIKSKVMDLDRCMAGNEEMASSLRRRWLQMKELVVTTMARLQ
ncbi:hypothetical protein EsDP_00006887 [Epichloe bromicola]|uniref:SET domain-containing protein n=1 Tax=Epichloe bromicola TaxID=79588 RepID=A0ABQ0CYY9_9HYPO